MKRARLYAAAALLLVASVIGASFQVGHALQALFAFDSSKVSGTVIALGAIGLLTMAFIQAARGLFPLRAWYHRRWVTRWLLRGSRGPNGDYSMWLLHRRLGVGEFDTTFYDLPLQNVCGQIAAIAETVLVECTRPTSTNDLPDDKIEREKQLQLLRCLSGSESNKDLVDLVAEGNLSEDRLNMIRARLASQIQRNIDNLQITAGTRWRRLLRITAFALSFLLSATLLLKVKNLGWQFLGLLGAAVIAGLIGGYLASVFRDIVASVEGLRRQ